MDAIELINKHVNIRDLMQHYGFDEPKEEGIHLRTSCKIHGGKDPSAFVANTETNQYYCHTGCGGGHLAEMVMLIEEVDFLHAVQRLADIFDLDIQNLHIREKKASYLEEIKQWVKFMRNKSKPEQPPYDVKEETLEVKGFRNFKEETLKHFGLKFVKSIECEKSNGEAYTLRDRLLIPIHSPYGVQIGASLRATKSTHFPRWSHQPINIKTNQILYNYDRVMNEKEIVVVEGIFDVWAFYEIGVHAVCTYGASLSKEQYTLLLKSGADVVLAFDGDHAGRVAQSKAITMLQDTTNLRIIQFNEGQDPESITREELKKHYDNRKR